MKGPPVIFSPSRRCAVRQRMLNLQTGPDPARYVMDDMVEDVLDRLSFLRHEPSKALVIGDWTGLFGKTLADQNCDVVDVEPAAGFEEEKPLSDSGFDLIASLGTLDTVNDLPGALIHIRNALAPGGMMIASFVGAGSLTTLRDVMLSADGDRPAPHIHPQIDVRAGGQLLQRTGFADPVIDSRPLDVRFGTFEALVTDLRTQGLSSVLSNAGPYLGKAGLARARDAFAAAADTEGRVTERFEILTLSGWRPREPRP